MDPETGKVVVVAITGVGALIWLLGLMTVVRASRERRESARRAVERFEVDEGRAPGTIVGEAEVEGDPEALSSKLAAQLALDSVGPFGPVKIVVRDRQEVRFEPTGRSPLGFRGGRVRFESVGGRTRVSYAL